METTLTGKLLYYGDFLPFTPYIVHTEKELIRHLDYLHTSFSHFKNSEMDTRLQITMLWQKAILDGFSVYGEEREKIEELEHLLAILQTFWQTADVTIPQKAEYAVSLLDFIASDFSILKWNHELFRVLKEQRLFGIPVPEIQAKPFPEDGYIRLIRKVKGDGSYRPDSQRTQYYTSWFTSDERKSEWLEYIQNWYGDGPWSDVERFVQCAVREKHMGERYL